MYFIEINQINLCLQNKTFSDQVYTRIVLYSSAYSFAIEGLTSRSRFSSTLATASGDRTLGSSTIGSTNPFSGERAVTGFPTITTVRMIKRESRSNAPRGAPRKIRSDSARGSLGLGDSTRVVAGRIVASDSQAVGVRVPNSSYMKDPAST